MARVEFYHPEALLHGTLCGVVFRYKNGKQHVHTMPLPSLPKRPTTEQRRKYHKDCVVMMAVAAIQGDELKSQPDSIEAMQEVADKYRAIRAVCQRMYDDFLPYFEGKPDKLKEAIVYWYECKRLAPKLELFSYALPEEYRVEAGNTIALQ